MQYITANWKLAARKSGYTFYKRCTVDFFQGGMCNLFWHIGLFFKLYAASLFVSVKNLHQNDHNCWTSHCPFVEHPQVEHYIPTLNTPILNPSLPRSLIYAHFFHNEGHWIELLWIAILGFFQLLNVLHSLVDVILAGVAEAQITCLVLIWTS